MTAIEYITIALTWAAAIFILVLMLRGRSRKAVLAPAPKPTPPPQPTFVRVGGITVDTRDFSPEVIEAVRKTYFRSGIESKYVQVMDLTVTCPRGHATRDRILLAARDLAATKELSAGILRSKAELSCDECGKQGKLTGRAVVWEGLGSTWDGAI